MTKELISGKTLRGPTAGRHFRINASVHSPTRAGTQTSEVTATSSHITSGKDRPCREAITLSSSASYVLRPKAFRVFGAFQSGRLVPRGREGGIWRTGRD